MVGKENIMNSPDKGGAGGGSGKEKRPSVDEIKNEVLSLMDNLEADLELEGFDKGNLEQSQEKYLRSALVEALRDVFRYVNSRAKDNTDFSNLKKEILTTRDEFIKDWISQKKEQNDDESFIFKELREMSIDELIKYLASVEQDSDKAKEALNVLNVRSNEIEDPQERAFAKARVNLQRLEVKAYSGGEDFSVYYNEILPTYKDVFSKGFKQFIEGLFLKQEEGLASNEELINREINEDAIDLIDYIIFRIKGKTYGGARDTSMDNDLPYNDEDFSYKPLSGENKIDRFKKHLHAKYKDKLDPSLIDALIQFAKLHDVRTVGYIPWLARGATRSHGTSRAGSDYVSVLPVCAPLAHGLYARERYGAGEADNTTTDLIWLKKGFYSRFVLPNDMNIYSATQADLAGVDEDVISNAKASEELRDITFKFHKEILWNGKVPEWVTDIQDKVGMNYEGAEIPADASTFPLILETIMDTLKCESSKREFNRRFEELDKRIETLDKKKQDKKINEEEYLRLKKEYVSDLCDEVEAYVRKNMALRSLEFDLDPKANITKRYNYLKSKVNIFGFNEFESEKGSMVHPSNYETSFKAMALMTDFFRAPVSSGENLMSIKEAHLKFQWFINKVIGKAKLIPGRHHLLFVAQTLRAIDKITDGFAGVGSAYETKKLLNKFISTLEGAGGVPSYVRKEVIKELKKNPAYFGMRSHMGYRKYKDDLYRFVNRTDDSLEVRVRGKIGLGLGKVDEDQMPLEIVEPWDWGKVADKNATEKS